eukprot:11421339-Ditylum_brightwellii.AAC.1
MGDIAQAMVNATQAEGCRELVCATLGVFARTEQEVECNGDEVTYGIVSWGSSPGGCDDVADTLKGDKLDMFQGWILFCVPAELTGEAKVDFPQSVHSGVSGPHAGVDLHV